jgi:hypothetical protein
MTPLLKKTRNVKIYIHHNRTGSIDRTLQQGAVILTFFLKIKIVFHFWIWIGILRPKC